MLRYMEKKLKGSREAAPSDIENQYNELEASMMEELDSLILMPPSRFCIYRVPDRLRRVRNEAYTPRVISIGPLHHGKKELKAMEEYKKRYLQFFLGRPNNLSLKDCIGKIRDREKKLRSCYSETIELTSDEFVRIILLDAIFLIEYLYRFLSDEIIDGIYGKPYDIGPDLMMLENQLPLFILKELYDSHVFQLPEISINRLCRYFLDNSIRVNLGGVSDNWKAMPLSEGEVLHLLDLSRKLYIEPMIPERKAAGESSQNTTTPSIEDLHLAGVKFKVASKNKHIFDIQFDHGILFIPKPKVIVYDDTEVLLRNLVAFEQCIGNEYYISNYVTIMDELVDTPEDAKLLADFKIVDINLAGGPHELSKMINSISTGVCPDFEFSYGDLRIVLNEFCDSKWHKRLCKFETQVFQHTLGSYFFRGRSYSPRPHYHSNNLLSFSLIRA